MDQAFTHVGQPYPLGAPRSKAWPGVAALLAVGACALLALWQLSPPRASGADAPPSAFSSARALRHLEAVAARPRPIGSAAHAEARDYLLRELSSLGLTTEVQRAAGVSRRTGSGLSAGTIENVLARQKGTTAGPAVLLVCHYDSVPTGAGASDDGSGVAALLETARALATGAPLRNDVVFLFTDAEEVGLLGAEAFVKGHAWAKEVGVVLNFEARGHTGQSIMFETSPGNRWLVEQFAAAAPDPVANSLSYEVYKRLPNDTDFTVFKRSGFAGLNFAYIEGVTHYHTLLDSVGNLDAGSLQHHGSYALSLARHFGDMDLSRVREAGGGTSEGDSVYFNILGLGFLRYSGAWVLPLLALTLLALGAVLYLGRRGGRLTLAGAALGALAFLAALVLTPLLLRAVWQVFGWLQRASGTDALAAAYRQHLCLLGFAAVSVAAVATVFVLLRRRIGAAGLHAGALLWWALAAAVTSIVSPGASYLFLWPLLFSVVGLAVLFRSKRGEASPLPLVALTLCALPGVALLTPTIYLLFTAMGLNALAAVGVLVVMLAGLLIPQLEALTVARRWVLPAGAALVGLALLSGGSLARGFDETRPRPDNIFYALDADSGRAVWASGDREPDSWTAQFLKGARRGALTGYAPQQLNNMLVNEAPALPLSPPAVELLDDTSAGGTRSLKLRVTSPRMAQVLTVYVDSDTAVQEAWLDGRRLEDAPARWRMSYYAPPAEGFELTLRVKPSVPLKLRVLDRSYGLPEVAGTNVAPRPAWSMPSGSLLYSDQSLVNKAYIF